MLRNLYPHEVFVCVARTTLLQYTRNYRVRIRSYIFFCYCVLVPGNTQAFCAMCEFHRHCTRVFNSSNGQVKPIPIVKNLRAIARHFHQGRQEDAHEFLRYFIDSLQKCCLQTIQQKLDVHTKATTLVHQIFGGYHRSQGECAVR